MSLEDQLSDISAKLEALISAIGDNTEAHTALGKIASKAADAKPASSKAKAADEKPAPAKEKPKPAPAKAKEEKKPEFEVVASTSIAEARTAIKDYVSEEGADTDARKAQLKAALDHLGARKLSEISEEDAPRLATYAAAWSAGAEVNFEEIDEMVAEAAPGSDDPLD